MKRLILALGLACFAVAARPSAAAELEILEPQDRSIVKGTINVRIKPQNEQTEMFFENPRLSIQDEFGTDLQKLEATLNPATGVCSAKWDTTKVKDGLYVIAISYRTLVRGATPQTDDDEITVAVRNGSRKPAKFTVKLEERPYKGEEGCEVTVKVLDAAGKPMPGARVSFKVDKGDIDTDVELTDGEGEAFTTVDSEEVATVTLTITVENLPPVKKVIRFVQ
jgi:hypothetical protein